MQQPPVENPYSRWVIQKIGNDENIQRLRVGINSVGRHSSSDIRIDSSFVSRHHAEIKVSENNNLTVLIKDLNSINGTYVNLSLYRAATIHVKSNDVISFGADYDVEDVENLPIYCIKLLSPQEKKTQNPPVIDEIVISDDEDEAELLKLEDMKPDLRLVNGNPENIAANNILSIFGNANDTILSELERINPVVCEAVKQTNNAEVISLESDDDEIFLKPRPYRTESIAENVEPHTSKATMDRFSIEKEKSIKSEVEIYQEEKENEEKKEAENGEDFEDENEMVFSQVLFDDIKSELADNVRDDHDEMELGSKDSHNKGNKNESAIVIALSDDENDDVSNENEDFDEDLEKKVSSWTSRLFTSQIFPNMNLSQVYEPLNSSHQYLIGEDETANNSSNLTTYDETNANIIESLLLPFKEKIDSYPVRQSRKSPAEDDLQESAVVKQKNERILSISDYDDSEAFKDETKEPLNSSHQYLNDEDETAKNSSNLSTSDETNANINKDLLKTLKEKIYSSPLRQKRKSPDEDDLQESPVVKHKKGRILSIPDYDDSETFKDETKEPDSLGIEKPKIKELEPIKKITENIIQNHSPKRTVPIVNAMPMQKGRRKSFKKSNNSNTNTHSKKSKNKDYDEIKSTRKERLKSLSTTKPKPKSPDPIKSEREKTDTTHHHAKVKNTVVNRGAFLCESSTTSTTSKPKKRKHSIDKAPKFNIPPVISTYRVIAAALSKSTAQPADKGTSQTQPPQLSKCVNKFTQVLRQHAEKARVRSAPKKLRFSDLERNRPEPYGRIQNSTTPTSTPTTPISTIPTAENGIPSATTSANTALKNEFNHKPLEVKPKKKVRFNDVPIIHYFDSNCDYVRKVDRKDIMPHLSYRQRRNLIRHTFPSVNHTDALISVILAHSNEWWLKRNSGNFSTEKLSSMPATFESFDHYRSVVFPLMKLEYMSTLEREFKANSKLKPMQLSIEDIIDNKGRLLLVTKCIGGNEKEFLHQKCDLVALKSEATQSLTFAYMVSRRKAGYPDNLGNSTKYFLEILPLSVDVNILRQTKLVSAHIAVDNLQVTIGAYNSIYQLSMTPLSEIILNPTSQIDLSHQFTTPKELEIAPEASFDILNDEQQHAIKGIFNRICFNKTETTPNISVIQGPPGTGKSAVVVNLALQLIYGMNQKFGDKKILICSQNNCAIDSVAAKLFDARNRIKDKPRRFSLIRFGIFEKMHSRVHPISLHNILEFERVRQLNQNLKTSFEGADAWKHHVKHLEGLVKYLEKQSEIEVNLKEIYLTKKKELEILQNGYRTALNANQEFNICQKYIGLANVVCVTLSSCVKLSQFVDYFDVCIIDEATQCTEPWTLLPLKFGISSLVLVGDSQQLPATVMSQEAANYGLARSLFTRIEYSIEEKLKEKKYEVNQGQIQQNRNNLIYRLCVQYRMHPEICKFPNMFFYKDMLKNAPNTLQHTTAIMPYSVLNLEYAHNEICSQGKITNSLEADFVVELLKALNEYVPINKNTYGVITPYAQHRKVLMDAISASHLPHVTVNTIDSYQGIEKDVIIISNARTSGVGFLANAQRLNVAITRPKKCLILCGNIKNLQSVPAWRCLLKDAQQRHLYHEISAVDVTDMRQKVIQRILVKSLGPTKS